MPPHCKLSHRVIARYLGPLLLALLFSVGVSARAQGSSGSGEAPGAAPDTEAKHSSQTAEFARAAQQARQILAREEFQQAEPSWWDRKKAQMRGWLARMFLSVDRITSSAPWLGHLMEWILFTAAAVALLIWVLRTVQRQRLRMALGGEATHEATPWARETEDWRRIAEEQAARGAWREAIHALYWSAIVHLERRRAWRHNPARTPREYVRLLRAGSPEQANLRALTAALERSWYGARETKAEEYESAHASFQQLAAGAERIGGGVDAAAGGVKA